jgi:Ser/Thr protein kinase RdoA (MazF antagonist)
LIFRGEEIKAILDFDNAREEVKVFDLAQALLTFAFATSDETALRCERAVRFLAKYRQEADLEAAEINVLPIFVQIVILIPLIAQLGNYFYGCQYELGHKIEENIGFLKWLDGETAFLRACQREFNL